MRIYAAITLMVVFLAFIICGFPGTAFAVPYLTVGPDEFNESDTLSFRSSKIP